MKTCFSASRASELLAGGTGKTRMNYIFELAEKMIGAEKKVTTAAMQHGIVNERTACDILCTIHSGVLNMGNNGEQIFYPVNEYIGATPDCYGLDWVGDAKCQFSIYNFIEQNRTLPKKYYVQIQVQMMAMKADKGYLINYLTKPEKWGEDIWTEYPFTLNERYHIHEISKDEQIQYEILEASEKYYPLIYECAEMLLNAKVITDEEFFYSQLKEGAKYILLKETNWQGYEGEVIRNGDYFYKLTPTDKKSL